MACGTVVQQETSWSVPATMPLKRICPQTPDSPGGDRDPVCPSLLWQTAGLQVLRTLPSVTEPSRSGPGPGMEPRMEAARDPEDGTQDFWGAFPPLSRVGSWPQAADQVYSGVTARRGAPSTNV
ncbi:hypothetical protein P7K49_021320, partial [Saguinus oedipus]